VLRPNSAARRDIVTDFAIGLVAESGMAGLTFGTLARAIGVTPAGIHYWVGNRARMLHAITVNVGQRWIAWIARRSYDLGASAFLPVTAEEIGWTRVWLALGDTARFDDGLAEIVTDFRDEERHLLHRLRPDLAADGLDAAMALVDGLRVAICLRHRPLSAVTAREVLSAELNRWGDGLRG
jgi:AcrR family transcriptional regulator